jgi:hypothetical protein
LTYEAKVIWNAGLLICTFSYYFSSYGKNAPLLSWIVLFFFNSVVSIHRNTILSLTLLYSFGSFFALNFLLCLFRMPDPQYPLHTVWLSMFSCFRSLPLSV